MSARHRNKVDRRAYRKPTTDFRTCFMFPYVYFACSIGGLICSLAGLYIHGKFNWLTVIVFIIGRKLPYRQPSWALVHHSPSAWIRADQTQTSWAWGPHRCVPTDFSPMLDVCCAGPKRSLHPRSDHDRLTLNIVLSMKASTRVFYGNPVVQDFLWSRSVQLYLLVTILPYMFLFGHCTIKCSCYANALLMLVSIVYTYAQTFWFWTSGYKNSDEVICGVGRDPCCSTVIRCLRVTAVTFHLRHIRHRHSDSADHAAKLYSRASGVFCSTDSEGIDKVRLGEAVALGIGVCTMAGGRPGYGQGTSGEELRANGYHNRSVASVRGGFFYRAAEAAWHGFCGIYRELSGRFIQRR